MVGVRRVFFPFALVCLALLWDDARIIGSMVIAASKTVPAQTRESSAETAPVTEEKKIPAEKSPSVIQMLEGRENDLILWASIAAVAFVIGWIWGGNYYLRRDRARSRKLRF
jgi:hypothetical protein